MIQLRCAICGQATVHGAAHQLMQSQRFPTVFLHNYPCMNTVWNVLVMKMGLNPTTPMIIELTRDREISNLLRPAK